MPGRRSGWVLASFIVCAGLECAAAASVALKVPLGHSLALTSADISVDGRFVVTGSEDKTVLLWDVATGREIRRFEGHSDSVTSVVFSPDGGLVLSGSMDRTARLWDRASGREIRRFDGVFAVSSVAFSPDGLSCITGLWDKTTRLWDVATGREIRRFTGHSDIVNAVAFSRSGHTILTGSNDKTARLWDVDTGQEIRRFEGHSGWVSSVAFSRDGKSILTGSWDKTARLWDVATGGEIHSFLHSGIVSGVAFSPDGGSVFTGDTTDGSARLWNGRTGGELHRFRALTGVCSVVFSADGRFVLAGFFWSARLWEVLSGNEIRTFEGYAGGVTGSAFSPDGHSVLTGGNDDQTVRLWNMLTGRQTRVFDGNHFGFTSVTFAADGRAIVAGSLNGTAPVWDFATGREMVRFTPNAGTSVTSVAFSPDGRTVLTGSDDSFTTDGGDIARLWDVATGRELRRFAGHSKQINSVAFSPDGHSALTGSRDRTARLWDIATGQEIRRFGHSNDVNAVAFSPDGKTILTGSADSTARLWDAATGQELRRFFIPKDLILAVAFSGDGRSVLTGSFGNTVRLWNVATGVEIRHFEGHTSPVDSVVFSPDDRLVLTGSWDGTAKIWNSDSGDLVATLVGFRDGGWAVISPDGRFDTGDVDGASALSWIADDDPDTPLPLEIFMRQYYTPRLRPRLLAGEKLPALPNIAALNRVQPGVKIVKVEADPKNSDNVRVVVEVKAETRNGIASGAKDLRLFRNGQIVAFREGDLKDGQYMFEGIRLAHRGPKVPVVFTAYAFNTSLIKSATATATYKLPDTWPERRGRVFLVDIGINRTLAKGCNLQYAVSDADAMRGVIEQRLQASGYAVEAQLLTADDRQPNGASKDHLRKVLADIAASATPDDLFVLTYSGHGYTDATGTFYLLPSDLKGDCARVDRELLASAISSDDLTQWIRPINAGEMVMVLDACYSAASIESGDFKPGPMGNPGLGQLAYDKRIRVLAASQATQPAGEAGALGMGYLSYSLVKNGLEGNEADWQPKDGAIWLREWLEYGVDRVPRLYENVREGKDTGSSRGIVMRHNNAVSLQTPALFDFRTAEDHGVELNGVQLK